VYRISLGKPLKIGPLEENMEELGGNIRVGLREMSCENGK
jgi:hypothetical protein